MSRFSKAMSVVVACLIPCLSFGAGATPISNLKLTSNANGNIQSFTNLLTVSSKTNITSVMVLGTNEPASSWEDVVAHGGGLSTTSSPTMATGTIWTFLRANVTNNASSDTDIVNWRTLTNAIATLAPIPAGVITNGQPNVNFGTNLMVRGNHVLTNEPLWQAFEAIGGVINGGVTVHGDTWLDGNVYVSQTLYVTNLYVTNIWTTITNLYVRGDGVITGDLTVSNVFRAGTIYGSMDATNIVNAPWLTNNQSGVTFGNLSVTANATAGTEVVNWQTMTNAIATLAPIPTGMPFLASNNTYLAGTLQAFARATVTNNATNGQEVVNYQTMTGYVAQATGNFITNGAAGTWTNLAAYYNDAGFVTNGQANVNFGTNLMVNGNPVLTNVAPFLLSVGVGTTTWSPITNITFLPTNGIAIDASVVGYKITLTVGSTNLVSDATFQNHTNNLDADVMHLTAAEKLLATNVINILDGTNTTVRTLGTTGVVVDVNIGTNGLQFASDCKLMMTTNNTLGVWYLNGGVWSNAFEVTR